MAKKSFIFTSHKEEVLDALKDKIADALDDIGATAEGHAKDGAPVDTGLLRNSITHAVSGQAPAISVARGNTGNKIVLYGGKAPAGTVEDMAVYVGTNVVYARRQETVAMRHTTGGAHFIKNAIADHGKEYKKQLKAALEK